MNKGYGGRSWRGVGGKFPRAVLVVVPLPRGVFPFGPHYFLFLKRCVHVDWVYTLSFQYIRFRLFWLGRYILDRFMKYPEKHLLKLPVGTLASIDAVATNRSEFVRDAIGVALVDIGIPDSTPKTVAASNMRKVDTAPVVKKNSLQIPVSEVSVPSGRQADAAVVLVALRKRSMSSRDAEKSMAWLGLRYLNAEKLLLSSGAVAVVDGLLTPT